ncbi:HAMP domain-containing sensor histidine kinase [Paenibacillus planticolens]|uniref:Heme sensor protein HssS n=1 Tax=Paenibacillus planticolens TaxID=2654976 RepID=A0ABX1ZKR4_9BACL|nr:HAMP domain-containing sensor histidine kinase [Paenibacillus planticolens]NOV00098.1 HAMP domain-containing protein [Paenibacillus planticolens]
MKSLYVRVVLTFLAAIVIGLISSFIIGVAIFQKELNELGQNDMIKVGDNLVKLYQQTQPQDLEAFMEKASELTVYPVQVFSASGEMKLFGSDKGQAVGIDRETIQHVLNGGQYRSKVKAQGAIYVGLPFAIGGQDHALFLLSSSKNEKALNRFLITILLLVLVIGSMCIVIAARFLVRPLKLLTRATKRLAKGDFNVELKMKRKDELGILARSFNETARELKQLEMMRQDFVSNVSHEIQSPLTSISGFAKALKLDHLVTPENRGRYLDIILKESDRLSRLSDNLLKLASLESKHHPFVAKTFNLDEQIRQVVVSCEPLWSAKHIRVDLRLPIAAKITADPDQLNQVWINLLGNSIKFTPDNGTIRIELIANTHSYTVIIKDSGIGITPEELNHIFVRFYKTDRSRNSIGSGLGLAIVKQIVLHHHGNIEVESEVGQGTKFTIHIPSSPPITL